MVGGSGEVEEPAGFGAFVETGEVGLGVAQVGEVAGFGGGIETGRGQMPMTVDAVMDGGVEPVAPADDGILNPSKDLSNKRQVR